MSRVPRSCLFPPVLALFLTSSICAQVTQSKPPAEPFKPVPTVDQFAAEPYVVQSLASAITMNADGTGDRLQTFSVKIHAEAALRQFSVASLTYASQSEHADFVYARVVRPDGTVLETPVTGALDQPAPVTREAPFYSDLKTKELPIKSLRTGDTLQWQVRFTIFHPEVANQFWGQDTFFSGPVVLDEIHELRLPATVHAIVWTNPRDGAPPAESTKDGRHIYRWHHTDLHPTVGPEADAARHAKEARLRTPDEELDAAKGKLPSFAWTTFPDWAAVGAWYRDLAAARVIPDDTVKAKAAELTLGKSTPEAKAGALYTYVSTQIRYIGVAFGIGRFQPHAAAEVLANQYGDCKDKVTLFAALLAASGLHADPVLIGAGIRFNPAVPSPSAFNHLIARVTLAGSDNWLDATAEVAPWRALLPVLRDQEALVIPAAASAAIARTPADLPYPAFTTTAVTGTLDPSLTADSQMVMTIRDDDELILRSVLRSVSPANYDAFLQQFMGNLGFGGTTSEPSFQNLDDSTKPLTLSFHYHRIKEKDWGDNRVTLPFAPIALPAFAQQKPPIAAIQLGTPRTETSTVELTLPKGWTAELPEAVHARTRFATCDVTYRLQPGKDMEKDSVKLFAERRFTILQRQVPVTDAKQYLTWYENAGVGSVPFLQLTPPVAATGAVSPHTTAGKDTAAPSGTAATLIQNAGERIRSMDPEGARKLLDQAKALNPQERGLWMGYAAVASQNGAPAEAIGDLQKELSLYPDELRLYRYLLSEQSRRNDGPGALATARAWAKNAPSDPEAEFALVQQLEAAKLYTEAFTEANDATTRLAPSGTDLTNLRLAAADAQTKLGHPHEAALALEPLLKTATDPSQINGIAYQLAEANEELPEAETAQRAALATLEAETTGWTLTEAPLPLLRKQNLLIAAWDTMGWIFYRENKLEEARAYLAAAYSNRSDSVVRDHLLVVATALKSPAATAFANKPDQQRRTFPLGTAKGRQGTAEFRIIVAAGKVIDDGPPDSASIPSVQSKPAAANLADAGMLLRSADLRALIPTGSHAHLIRSGFVNCHAQLCELVLAP